MQKQITVPELGLVQISKKSNAKNLKIRIHPEKGVLVTIPMRTSFREGKKFVLKNIDWIKEKTQILNIKVDEARFNPDSIFITRASEIKFEVDARIDFKGKFKNDTLTFYYNPLKIDFDNLEIQDFIKKVILKILTKEARVYLNNRYKRLSEKHNLFASKISIGSAATRWGTCNTRNEIRLSCRLMLLPDHLIDYIILHEMCHIIHKNHGKDFHNLLNTFSEGKSSALNKELKQHSIHIKPGDYRF